jgi:hypothetical protein
MDLGTPTEPRRLPSNGGKETQRYFTLYKKWERGIRAIASLDTNEELETNYLKLLTASERAIALRLNLIDN